MTNERTLEDLFECIATYSDRARLAFAKGKEETVIGFITLVEEEIKVLHKKIDNK